MNSTNLSGRILWEDGTSTIPHDRIVDMITNGENVSGVYTDKLTSDISTYNKYVSGDDSIHVKEQHSTELDYSWKIPDNYKSLDVLDYLIDQLALQDITDDEYLKKYHRIINEYNLYKSLGYIQMLQASVYIINTLTEHQVAWGVGRGSSTSSYILFLIGVHDVDSILYELDITDFLKLESNNE